MNTTTVTRRRTAPDTQAPSGISPFGRPRPASAAREDRRIRRTTVGDAPLRDPRGDLSMFDPRPSRCAASPSRGEWLTPVLPPVISEPPRRRARPARAGVAQRRPGVTAPAPATSTVGAPRRAVHLTRRGRAVLLGSLVGAIALCSAITVGGTPEPAPVSPTQVVARGGESVDSLAERAAQGRDIQAVAESIRLANGLDDGELPQAGDVLLVPGS